MERVLTPHYGYRVGKIPSRCEFRRRAMKRVLTPRYGKMKIGIASEWGTSPSSGGFLVASEWEENPIIGACDRTHVGICISTSTRGTSRLGVYKRDPPSGGISHQRRPRISLQVGEIPLSGRHEWVVAETSPEWGHIPSSGVSWLPPSGGNPIIGRMLDGCICIM